MSTKDRSRTTDRDAEPRTGNLYRLTNRLWIELPEGTMERAEKNYRYFKNGGKGRTLRDVEQRVRQSGA